MAFTTIIVSFINWGLGLVFGAILARKVGEYAVEKNININYLINRNLKNKKNMKTLQLLLSLTILTIYGCSNSETGFQDGYKLQRKHRS